MSAAAPTTVVADTTHYLPADLISANGIHQISLYVGIEGQHQRESEIRDYDAFYERLRYSAETVTTSQPSVGDFIAVYAPLLAGGGEIVSVHLASGISGTCQSARQAKQQLAAEGKGGDRIHVCDSVTAAGGMGLLVLVAAAAAARGLSGEEVVERVNTARESLKMWFAVDTLEYLRRGGRIGAARAWLGSALKIKPILTFEEEVKPVERVRTRARSVERLLEYARRLHGDGADAWVVQHIQDSDTADRLVEGCKEVFGGDPVFVSEIGPVLGAHAGPGLVGIGATRGEFLQ